jgi:hypothetical protein
MFHLRGQVARRNRGPLEKVEVAIKGGGFEKAVSTDSNGLYSVDLPLGRYTIVVTPPDQRVYLPYRRPLFQVVKPITVVIDITIRGTSSCDFGFVSGGSRIDSSEVIQQNQAAIESQLKDSCGGSDSFVLPSKTHVPFEVLIDYFRRDSSREPEFTYEGASLDYNLFTLKAHTIVYNSETHVVEGRGDVELVSKDQATSKTDDLSFRLKDGEAIPYSPAQ